MAGLTVDLPKPTILQPGEEEKQLVQGYRDESAGLESRLAPIRESMGTLQGEIGQIGAGMPQPPKMQAVPDFQPRQVDANEMMTFATLATAFAALGSKMTRTGITGALTAAGGAMKGFNEGNIQQAKIDADNFQMQMRSVIANNNKMLEEYSAVLNDRKLTLAQKMNMYNVLAHRYQDEIGASAMRKGDIRFELDRLDKMRNAQNNLEVKMAQMQASIAGQVGRLEAQQEPVVAIKGPNGVPIYVPRSQAVGQEPAPSSQSRPPPAEVMRMNIAIGAANKALDNYANILREFDPRSWDQLSPTQRAKIESAVSGLQLEWKEAAALGALTGPDLEIMERTLVSPSSMKGAYYGREGLGQQIEQARGYFNRRQESIRNFYPEAGGAPPPAAPRPSSPSGTQEGQRGTSKSGKPIIFRNGRWEYMQ